MKKQGLLEKLIIHFSENKTLTKKESNKRKWNWESVVKRISDYNRICGLNKLSIRLLYTKENQTYTLIGKNLTQAKKLLKK